MMLPRPALALGVGTLLAIAGCTDSSTEATTSIEITYPDGTSVVRTGGHDELIAPLTGDLAVPLVDGAAASFDPADVLRLPRARVILPGGAGAVWLERGDDGTAFHLGEAQEASLIVRADLAAHRLVIDAPAGELRLEVDGVDDPVELERYFGSVSLALATAQRIEQLPELDVELGLWSCLKKLFKIGGGPVGVAIDVVLLTHQFAREVECRAQGAGWCYTSCADEARRQGKQLKSATATCDGASLTCSCEFKQNLIAGSGETCSTSATDPFPCPSGFGEPGDLCVEETQCCSTDGLDEPVPVGTETADVGAL